MSFFIQSDLPDSENVSIYFRQNRPIKKAGTDVSAFKTLAIERVRQNLREIEQWGAWRVRKCKTILNLRIEIRHSDSA
jgi:hypothetical protein